MHLYRCLHYNGVFDDSPPTRTAPPGAAAPALLAINVGGSAFTDIAGEPGVRYAHRRLEAEIFSKT